MSLNNAGSIGGTTSITFHEGDDVEVFIERFDMAMRCERREVDNEIVVLSQPGCV